MGIGQLPEKVHDWAIESDAAKRHKKIATLIAIACRVIRVIGSAPYLWPLRRDPIPSMDRLEDAQGAPGWAWRHIYSINSSARTNID
jgi:hypothetical protein